MARCLLVRIKDIVGDDDIPPMNVIIDTLQVRYPADYENLMNQELAGMIYEALGLETDNRFDDLRDALLWKTEKDNGSRFKHFGALDNVLEDIKSKWVFWFNSPFKGFLHERNPGFLLIGPSGCGKTTLAHAIANEVGFPFYKVSGSQLLSGRVNLEYLFTQAIKTAPSIVFIDDLSIIGNESKFVSQLNAFMDGSFNYYVKGEKVLLIGATGSLDTVDSSLTRSCRFEQFSLSVRGVKARHEILKVLTKSLKLKVQDLGRLAEATPGFVGFDLRCLVDMTVMKLFPGGTQDLSNHEDIIITMSDFEATTQLVKPLFRSQNPTSIPDDVTWDDIGGYDELKATLTSLIVDPIEYPEMFEEPDNDFVTGFLLWGPPGCGKTLIAHAVAYKAGACLIRTTGSELVSQLEVQEVFSRAKKCSPCILLIQHVDGIVSPSNGGGALFQPVLYQLFKELEDAYEHKGIFIIGTTNRPEVFLDKGILKRERFGKCLYVALPKPDERVSILKAIGRKMPLDTDVDLDAIGRSDRCENFNGADLKRLMNAAALLANEEEEEAPAVSAEAGTAL